VSGMAGRQRGLWMDEENGMDGSWIWSRGVMKPRVISEEEDDDCLRLINVRAHVDCSLYDIPFV